MAKKVSVLRVIASLDADEVIDSMLGTLSQEEMVEFVKRVDRAAADWSFTARLYEHFKREMKKMEAEDKAHAAAEKAA